MYVFIYFCKVKSYFLSFKESSIILCDSYLPLHDFYRVVHMHEMNIAAVDWYLLPFSSLHASPLRRKFLITSPSCVGNTSLDFYGLTFIKIALTRQDIEYSMAWVWIME